MTPLLSKRHLIQFYLVTILCSLFFLFMGMILLLIFLKEFTSGDLKPKEYFIPVFSVGCFYMTFYTVYKYYKNAPVISIDASSISFNKEIFLLADLRKIEFTGKRGFNFIGSFPMEAATLRFKNGKKKFIFDDIYQNTWEFKTF